MPETYTPSKMPQLGVSPDTMVARALSDLEELRPQSGASCTPAAARAFWRRLVTVFGGRRQDVTSAVVVTLVGNRRWHDVVKTTLVEPVVWGGVLAYAIRGKSMDAVRSVINGLGVHDTMRRILSRVKTPEHMKRFVRFTSRLGRDIERVAFDLIAARACKRAMLDKGMIAASHGPSTRLDDWDAAVSAADRPAATVSSSEEGQDTRWSLSQSVFGISAAGI